MTKVFTYQQQPTDNVDCWRIGEACRKAADDPKCGDYIDRGLILLRELQAQGYGVVKLQSSAAETSASERELTADERKMIERGLRRFLAAGPCDLPPEGWKCTRGKGHEGPCAAEETSPAQPLSPLGLNHQHGPDCLCFDCTKRYL